MNDPYAKARHLYGEGDFKGAKALLGDCLRNGYRIDESCTLLGTIFQLEGDFPKAIACYRRAIDEGCHHPDCLGGLGVSLFEDRQYEEAEKVLREALRVNPTHLQAQVDLGRLLIETRRNEEAAHFLKEAAARHPDSAQICHLLAIALYRLNRHEEAIAAADAAIAIDPDTTPQTHLLKGEAHLALGEITAAIDAFKRSVKIYPLKEVYYPAARAYQLKQDFETSIKLYDKVLSLSDFQQHDVVFFHQGAMLFELGDIADHQGEVHDYYDRAISKFQAALKNNPGFLSARHHVALAYLKRGDVDRAEEILAGLVALPDGGSTSPLGIDPVIDMLNSAFLWRVHYGYVLSLKGRPTEGVEMLQAALNAKEVQQDAAYRCRLLRRIGIALLDSGQYERAANVWQELRPMDGDNFYQSETFLLEANRRLRESSAGRRRPRGTEAGPDQESTLEKAPHRHRLP